MGKECCCCFIATGANKTCLSELHLCDYYNTHQHRRRPTPIYLPRLVVRLWIKRAQISDQRRESAIGFRAANDATRPGALLNDSRKFSAQFKLGATTHSDSVDLNTNLTFQVERNSESVHLSL